MRASRYDEALKDLDAVLAETPQDVSTLEYRSRAFADQSEWERAVGDLEEAARLEPQRSFAPAQLAWWQSTCATKSVRDDRKALEHALAACKLCDWKKPRALFALAAAFAESGDFKTALSWQTKANALTDDKELRDFGEELLEGYQRERPYRSNQLAGNPMDGLWEELRTPKKLQLDLSIGPERP